MEHNMSPAQVSSKKTVVVFGATGTQGSSVVDAILSHPRLSQIYFIRAVTRDPSSEKAKSLRAKYADGSLELAKADLNSPPTLLAVVKGAYAVFAVTNFWESMSASVEIQQGKNIADAAFQTLGLRHLIWSSLPNITRMSNGTLRHAEHFDGKYEVQEYLEAMKQRLSNSGFGSVSGTLDVQGGERTRPATTYFMPGFYMTNAVLEPRNGAITLPWNEDTKVPLFDAQSDTGKFVAGILESGPTAMDGKTIRGVSQWATASEITKTIAEVKGEEVVFKTVPEGVWKGFLPEAVREELTDTMLLVRELSYYGKGAEKEQQESDTILYAADGLQKTTFKAFLGAQNGAAH